MVTGGVLDFWGIGSLPSVFEIPRAIPRANRSCERKEKSLYRLGGTVGVGRFERMGELVGSGDDQRGFALNGSTKC